DGSTWHLQVTGLVEQPLDLSRDALTALPAVQITRTLECISNEVGGDLISTGVWTGVLLADVLQRAGVRSGASAVVFHSVDGYVETMALDKAQDPNTLLAYALNGQPLPTKHGFPLRVLGSGTYGMKNSKWLTQIDVVAAVEPGFWEQQGWNPDAPVQTLARIDTPKDAETVTGATSISGVAFAADRGIQRVRYRLTLARRGRTRSCCRHSARPRGCSGILAGNRGDPVGPPWSSAQ
ncbi:MAG TPA: molybdopterin-dependent oxidoreductase, partial [Chloroflexota bacterium]|nr:molybdopterin-dependent oxidoreductase [Chloroflexota bacterium]